MIVAYDIGHDGRRQAVARLLLGRGVRLQRSVYDIAGDDARELGAAVTSLLSLDRDTLHVFPECPSCARARLEYGQAPPPLGALWWIA